MLPLLVAIKTCDVAQQVEDKDFLIIECTRGELSAVTLMPCICDYCAKPSETGYYIAVLNSWYCPKCYKRWRKSAKPYESDKPIERRNFQYYGTLLGVL